MDIPRIDTGRWVRQILLISLILWAMVSGLGAAENGLNPEQSFAGFARNWVDHLQSAYLYTRQSPKLEQTATGVVASFHALDKASIHWDVKPAQDQPGVYTAVLFYKENLLRSRAPTEALALSGNFSVEATQQIMEIFLYENGAWVH